MNTRAYVLIEALKALPDDAVVYVLGSYEWYLYRNPNGEYTLDTDGNLECEGFQMELIATNQEKETNTHD